MLISGTTGIDLTGLPINNSGNAEIEGNLNLSGVGKRITGDFSNATVSNRTIFQTSTANSSTGVYFIPNTLSGSAAVRVTNSNDTVNFNSLEINANPSTTSIISNFAGTASALPLTFVINNAERMRIDTAGNVGIGVTPSAWGSGFKALQQQNTSISSNLNEQYITSNGYYNGSNWIYNSNTGASQYLNNQGIHTWKTAPSGTAGNPITWTNAMTLDASGALTIDTANTVNYFAIKASGADKIYLSGGASYGAFSTGDCGIGAASGYSLKFGSNNTIKMNLDTSGNLLLTSGTGGLGYGTGAGGTVTQLTSKSTAVTLNKPTGLILTNNASLSSGATIEFIVNNSLFLNTDLVVIMGQDYASRYKIEAHNGNNNNGLFNIRITNITASSYTDIIKISFAIIKGATA